VVRAPLGIGFTGPATGGSWYKTSQLVRSFGSRQINDEPLAKDHLNRSQMARNQYNDTGRPSHVNIRASQSGFPSVHL
jgi:hypothetical protein